ncbi:MAG: hypothetical protein RLZZ272_1409 [Actinomycetota bacterium]|jgi:hypothetical protein
MNGAPEQPDPQGETATPTPGPDAVVDPSRRRFLRTAGLVVAVLGLGTTAGVITRARLSATPVLDRLSAEELASLRELGALVARDRPDLVAVGLDLAASLEARDLAAGIALLDASIRDDVRAARMVRAGDWVLPDSVAALCTAV